MAVSWLIDWFCKSIHVYRRAPLGELKKKCYPAPFNNFVEKKILRCWIIDWRIDSICKYLFSQFLSYLFIFFNFFLFVEKKKREERRWGERWGSWQCSKSHQGKTSNAGSQYHCGRVGRGSQPPSTHNAPPNPLPTQTHTQDSKTLIFPTFWLVHMDEQMDEWTDRWTDELMDGWTCGQSFL